MLAILSWIVTGLIVGALARLVMPGRQSIGTMGTILLGILGAFVGGAISWAIWGGANEPFSAHAWPGYLLAVLGAVLLLALGARMGGSRSLPGPTVRI